jgi:DNA primase catalytic core
MARVPAVELERLKREVSVRRLAEARGVVFKKSGDDNWMGLCCFHPDKTPSLVVSEKKNVWHCLGACRAGGGPIDFVMKAEGVAFRHAVDLLREGVALEGPVGPKHATVPKLPSPLVVEADDATLLRQVRDYYHQQLKVSPEAITYLASRGLNHPALIDAFHLGFANRTLSLRIPYANRESGAKLRGRLQSLGVLRESGHEHLNGSLVVPIHEELGAVVGMYGRKVNRHLRAGTPDHLYLPGPHRAAFNSAALAEGSGAAILCEALIDALSFWAAGFRNVTSAYGVEGFTPHHLEALKRHHVKHVVIAYDRDAAGDAGALALAKQLEAQGFDCFRAVFPHSMDANAVACKVLPASKSLGLVLQRAAFMGTGVPRGTPDFSSLAAASPADSRAPTTTGLVGSEGGKRVAPTLALKVATVPAPSSSVPGNGAAAAAPIVQLEHATEIAITDAASVAAPNTSSARVAISAPITETASSATSPLTPSTGEVSSAGRTVAEIPRPANTTAPTSTNDDEALFNFGPRRYRVRGLSKPHGPDSLRFNLLLSVGESFHVDTFDLYSAKARVAFIQQAAQECSLDVDTLKRDVGHLLLQLEALLEKRREEKSGPKVPTLTEAEREEALELLRAPDLLQRVLADFIRCGVVGEENNKLVGYLAAVSRKLEEPLAVLIQSSSAAGKSSLMEAVLAFVPEEEKQKYSAMTGQSLFYMGDSNLRHKVLAVVEEEGASRASYALKLLQSEGELTIASTGKDPHTGRLVTHEYHVEGPTQLFLTTTATELDDELLNRCLVLTVDEETTQTSAIHKLQREKRTLEGRFVRKERDAVLKLHQDAQRLLRPLVVVNPYARALAFPADRTRARRDFPKYLTLIDAIALLHQYQRPVKTAQRGPHLVEYVEVTPEDISTANALAAAVLSRSLDELPPQTRRLLQHLAVFIEKRAAETKQLKGEVRFTRREVREVLGFRNSQLALHLGRLVDFEYLVLRRDAHGAHAYSLCDVEALTAPALTDVGVSAATTPQLPGDEASFRGLPAPSGAGTGSTSLNGSLDLGAENVSFRASGNSHSTPAAASYLKAATS